MKKKAFALLGAVGTVLSPMTVLAEDYVYWEDIPSGEENQYINAGEETIIDAYKDLKEDEANALKVSLESTYTKVILKSYDVKTGETTKSLEMKFDSYEKASEYIKDLEDKGIVVENISFVNDTEDEEGSLEKTYSTLEEAASALEEFKDDSIRINNDITLKTLIEAFAKFKERQNFEKPLNTVVTKKEYSVHKRNIEIMNKLKEYKQVKFEDLFETFTKDYIVVTFLSILELAKKGQLEIKQSTNLDTIIINAKGEIL